VSNLELENIQRAHLDERRSNPSPASHAGAHAAPGRGGLNAEGHDPIPAFGDEEYSSEPQARLAPPSQRKALTKRDEEGLSAGRHWMRFKPGGKLARPRAVKSHKKEMLDVDGGVKRGEEERDGEASAKGKRKAPYHRVARS
jgi:hypothetical protein